MVAESPPRPHPDEEREVSSRPLERECFAWVDMLGTDSRNGAMDMRVNRYPDVRVYGIAPDWFPTSYDRPKGPAELLQAVSSIPTTHRVVIAILGGLTFPERYRLTT